MHLFVANNTRRTKGLVRAAGPITIPEPLVGLVEQVHGLDDFPPPGARLRSTGVKGYPGDSITPLVISKA